MLNYAVLQTVSLARGQKRRWLPKHQHQSDITRTYATAFLLCDDFYCNLAHQAKCWKNVLPLFFIFLLGTYWISLKRERCAQGTPTHKRCYGADGVSPALYLQW